MGSVGSGDVRNASVSSTFYSKNPGRLREEVDDLFERSDSIDLEGEIKALVCPHAGYKYSGLVAAAAYRLLKDRDYSVVAVIAPSHYEAFSGVSVFCGKGYETPLGLAKVDSEKAQALIAQSDSIKSSWAGHGTEHALEVQLPFLQAIVDGLRIIPIVMGEQSWLTCQLLGEALGTVLAGEHALVVASSDLSHRRSYEEAIEIDGHTAALIETFDEVTLKRELDEGTCEACGGGAIIASMIASKKFGAQNARVLAYRNSGDTGGPRSEVVGYLSVAIGNLN